MTRAVDSLLTDTDNYVRQNPTQSLVYALLAGLLLRTLPIAGLIAMTVRLALVCLKPAILIYAATKLYNESQRADT